MKLVEQINFVYSAGETRRFHTWPVLRERTIAHHSWHVAMLLHLLYGQDEPGLRPVVILAALAHDAAEWRFGDMPSPAKRELDERFQIRDKFESVPGETTSFREAFSQIEEEELAKYGLDWDKFLEPEEKRKLKFCDNLEGAFYCIQEQAMGNKFIRPAFKNFYTYLLEFKDLSDVETEVLAYVGERWEAVNAR